jgi:hypothetical protein
MTWVYMCVYAFMYVLCRHIRHYPITGQARGTPAYVSVSVCAYACMFMRCTHISHYAIVAQALLMLAILDLFCFIVAQALHRSITQSVSVGSNPIVILQSHSRSTTSVQNMQIHAQISNTYTQYPTHTHETQMHSGRDAHRPAAIQR